MASKSTRTQQAANRTPNPINAAYNIGAGFQFFTWVGSIIVFSLAAVTVARTPSDAPLYIAAVFNLSVGVTYFVSWLPVSIALTEPAARTTARPSVLYILLHVCWFCLWGATGPLMLMYRDENGEDEDPAPSSYAKRKLIGLISSIVVASPRNIPTACGAFGIICFFFYFCSMYGVLKVLVYPFTEEHVRIYWEVVDSNKAERLAKANANANSNGIVGT